VCGLLRWGGCSVESGGCEACVAEQLGDDHEVGAAAHERRRERAPVALWRGPARLLLGHGGSRPSARDGGLPLLVRSSSHRY
jgi:hypothetical protein